MDERKQVSGQVRDYIHIKLPTTEAEKLASRNFHYDAGFTLSPGRYRMRFLVREGQSGKMGIFDTRFVIPDLAADSMTLKTSSIVWSSQRECSKPRWVGGTDHQEDRHREPADYRRRKGGAEYRQGLPPRAEHVRRFRRVRRRARSQERQRPRQVAVEMSLFNQKGDKAFEVGPVKATELVATRPDAVPVQIQIPLKNVAPGRYVCQLNVIDEVGRKFAFPRTSVVIQ
jgi:hypothetical protein